MEGSSSASRPSAQAPPAPAHCHAFVPCTSPFAPLPITPSSLLLGSGSGSGSGLLSRSGSSGPGRSFDGALLSPATPSLSMLPLPCGAFTPLHTPNAGMVSASSAAASAFAAAGCSSLAPPQLPSLSWPAPLTPTADVAASSASHAAPASVPMLASPLPHLSMSTSSDSQSHPLLPFPPQAPTAPAQSLSSLPSTQCKIEGAGGEKENRRSIPDPPLSCPTPSRGIKRERASPPHLSLGLDSHSQGSGTMDSAIAAPSSTSLLRVVRQQSAGTFDTGERSSSGGSSSSTNGGSLTSESLCVSASASPPCNPRSPLATRVSSRHKRPKHHAATAATMCYSTPSLTRTIGAASSTAAAADMDRDRAYASSLTASPQLSASFSRLSHATRHTPACTTDEHSAASSPRMRPLVSATGSPKVATPTSRLTPSRFSAATGSASGSMLQMQRGPPRKDSVSSGGSSNSASEEGGGAAPESTLHLGVASASPELLPLPIPTDGVVTGKGNGSAAGITIPKPVAGKRGGGFSCHCCKTTKKNIDELFLCTNHLPKNPASAASVAAARAANEGAQLAKAAGGRSNSELAKDLDEDGGGTGFKRCRKKYCLACMKRLYARELMVLRGRHADEWTCPSCLNRCSCAGCERRLQGLSEAPWRRSASGSSGGANSKKSGSGVVVSKADCIVSPVAPRKKSGADKSRAATMPSVSPSSASGTRAAPVLPKMSRKQSRTTEQEGQNATAADQPLAQEERGEEEDLDDDGDGGMEEEEDDVGEELEVRSALHPLAHSHSHSHSHSVDAPSLSMQPHRHGGGGSELLNDDSLFVSPFGFGVGPRASPTFFHLPDTPDAPAMDLAYPLPTAAHTHQQQQFHQQQHQQYAAAYSQSNAALASTAAASNSHRVNASPTYAPPHHRSMSQSQHQLHQFLGSELHADSGLGPLSVSVDGGHHRRMSSSSSGGGGGGASGDVHRRMAAQQAMGISVMQLQLAKLREEEKLGVAGSGSHPQQQQYQQGRALLGSPVAIAAPSAFSMQASPPLQSPPMDLVSDAPDDLEALLLDKHRRLQQQQRVTNILLQQIQQQKVHMQMQQQPFAERQFQQQMTSPTQQQQQQQSQHSADSHAHDLREALWLQQQQRQQSRQQPSHGPYTQSSQVASAYGSHVPAASSSASFPVSGAQLDAAQLLQAQAAQSQRLAAAHKQQQQIAAEQRMQQVA